MARLQCKITEDAMVFLKAYCKETGYSQGGAVMHAIRLLQKEDDFPEAVLKSLQK